MSYATPAHQTKARSAESSGPDRYERQINKISGLLEKTVLQTSSQHGGQKRQIQSIFPGETMHHSVLNISIHRDVDIS